MEDFNEKMTPYHIEMFSLEAAGCLLNSECVCVRGEYSVCSVGVSVKWTVSRSSDVNK